MDNKERSEPGVTIEEAQRIIQEQQREQFVRCQRAIQAVLQQYQCALVAVPQITPDGRISCVVTVRPAVQERSQERVT